MTYVILSAAYANASHTAAVIQTPNIGAVLLSLSDTPAEWALMLEWGNPTDYVAPSLPVPTSVTRLQFAKGMWQAGRLTTPQAKNVAAGVTIPAVVAAEIATLPTQALRDEAEIDYSAATVNRERSILVRTLKSAGMTDAQLDAFFVAAAGL